MVTPVSIGRSAPSGQTLYAGRTDQVDPPSWISSKPIGQWFNAPNSILAGLATINGGASSAIMNAYSGTVMANGKLYAFGGGHGASPDNTVARYDLFDGAGWEVFCQPTPAAQMVYASNTGTMTLANFWWGDPGNLKPNPPHTYSYGQYIPEKNRIIWLCHRGVYNYSGGIGTQFNRMLQLNLTDATWVQPGAADDIYPIAGDQFASVRLPNGKVIAAGSGSGINQIDFSQPVGSMMTSWLVNNALNWTGYGQFLLDSPRNRIIRVGNGYSTAMYFAIDLTTKAITDIKPLLNGDAGVLTGLNNLSIQDTMGGCIDPINNRIVLPLQAAGGAYYAINLDTWAVTLNNPVVVPGSTVMGNSNSASCFGRVHYYAPFKCIFYSPDGSGSLCVMRLG